jgi:succinate dehydrogenase / fumarate reductase flavoprotein subunit/fumarate reductase flavoprotein subunit
MAIAERTLTSLPFNTEHLSTDLAVIGSGGAGLLAALTAARAAPGLKITLISKGAVGRSGCTIMTQGFNAALDPADSVDSHFKDMLEAGEFLNDQDLAWQLASDAPGMIRELEGSVGCFFDRCPDGRIQQLPFAGQSFNRKVHRGDETGLEIMSRLSEALSMTGIDEREDVRALDLLLDDNGSVAGLALLDMRRGIPLVLSAPVVIVASGGAPNMYRPSSAAKEKSGDGMAMCYRAGARFRDMEMMQFLSVGLVSGTSGHTGIPLEERMRYAGVHLLNTNGDRFMAQYDAQNMERAGRDQVVRAAYSEIRAGRGTASGGILLDARHLGRDRLEKDFAEIVSRARLLGQDPLTQPVEMAPTAHFQIGGVLIGSHGETNVPGLLVVGEDAGGVHGASWTGGNGVAESTVFGARAGIYAANLKTERQAGNCMGAQARRIHAQAFSCLQAGEGEDPFLLTRELQDVMWRYAGPVRDGPGIQRGLDKLSLLDSRAETLRVMGGRETNLAWQQAMDLRNLLTIGRAVLVSALARQESRGTHFRTDYPQRDEVWLRYVVLCYSHEGPVIETRPVRMTRISPGQVAP